jgi:hypothetical protein
MGVSQKYMRSIYLTINKANYNIINETTAATTTTTITNTDIVIHRIMQYFDEILNQCITNESTRNF